MNFMEKTYTLASALVLICLGACSFIFEMFAASSIPPLQTYYLGYIFLGAGAVSLAVNRILFYTKKTKAPLTYDNFTPHQKELITKLIAEFKFTVSDCQFIQNQIRTHQDYSNRELLVTRKEKVLNIHSELQNLLKENQASDLLKKLISAYASSVDKLLAASADELESKLTSLQEKVSKETVLNTLLNRIEFKKVSEIDPIFDLKLSHN